LFTRLIHKKGNLFPKLEIPSPGSRRARIGFHRRQPHRLTTYNHTESFPFPHGTQSTLRSQPTFLITHTQWSQSPINQSPINDPYLLHITYVHTLPGHSPPHRQFAPPHNNHSWPASYVFPHSVIGPHFPTPTTLDNPDWAS